MHIVTMTSNGRLTIPKTLRKRLGIKKGTMVAIVERDNKIFVQKVDRNYFLQFVGILPTKGKMLKRLVREKKREKIL